MSDDLRIEWSRIEKMAQRGLGLLGEYLQNDSPRAAIPLAACSDLQDRVMRGPAPRPGDGEDLMELFFEAARASQNLSSPYFFGYIPTGGLATAALAQLLATGANPYTALSHFTPALVAMEHGVLSWLCRLFGLPDSAIGTMTTGTSLALLSAVVAARQLHLGEDLRGGTVYASRQVHHTVAKALRIAGLPANRLRLVDCTADGRMDPRSAAAAIAADRAAGRRPFLIVATAGTTATGCVDPLEELGDLAAAENLWFHVDAAYGGGFQLTARGRRRLAGIEKADSLTMDPHKSLFLPVGTGILLVRRSCDLRNVFAQSGAVLADLQPGNDLPDYADLGPELTREFRGLRLWLPLHLHGTDAFSEALDRMLDLAEAAYQRFSTIKELEVGCSPDLSIVTFRLRDRSNSENQNFLQRINSTGEAFLSGVEVEGVYFLRLAFLNQNLDHEHLDATISVIMQAMGESVEILPSASAVGDAA